MPYIKIYFILYEIKNYSYLDKGNSWLYMRLIALKWQTRWLIRKWFRDKEIK